MVLKPKRKSLIDMIFINPFSNASASITERDKKKRNDIMSQSEADGDTQDKITNLTLSLNITKDQTID
jgi:hypothetical protein